MKHFLGGFFSAVPGRYNQVGTIALGEKKLRITIKGMPYRSEANSFDQARCLGEIRQTFQLRSIVYKTEQLKDFAE